MKLLAMWYVYVIPSSNEVINIPEAVKKYELAGGSIINAVRYTSLKSVEKKATIFGLSSS